MSGSRIRPMLIRFADEINDIQQQRTNGVPFLSAPRTYSMGDLPGCPVCNLPAESIRVGETDEVMGFKRAPIPVTCQPCGHQIQIHLDEAEQLLDYEQQRQRVRENWQAGSAVPHMDGDGSAVPCPDGDRDSPAEESGDDEQRRPEPPDEDDLNPALPVRPDPRQPAYDAVYEYLRGLGPYLPRDIVHRNAVIWRAVHAALGATPVGRCISSHCVEGDHMVPVEGEAP